MQAGNLDAAEIAFVKLKPRNQTMPTHSSIWAMFLQQTAICPAADSYREAIRLNPNLAHAHYNLAICLLRLNDQKAADKEFQEARAN